MDFLSRIATYRRCEWSRPFVALRGRATCAGLCVHNLRHPRKQRNPVSIESLSLVFSCKCDFRNCTKEPLFVGMVGRYNDPDETHLPIP